VIYHQERYTRERGWYFSPHFHLLTYFSDKFKCRGCERFGFASRRVCGGCDGFEARTRSLYDSDGWICKIARSRKTGRTDVRQTVGGSSWYLLSHSSYRVDAKRHNIATWWGNCSYRRLKVKVERKKRVCPHCGGELVNLEYRGHAGHVLCVMHGVRPKRGNGDFWSDYVEDGKVVWFEVVHRCYGGG
jgi:hypothetical protein